MTQLDPNQRTAVPDPPRCAICGTKVTLYPLGWKACPHCGKPVCRQCWGATWASKTFDAEKCAHSDGSAGPAVVPIGEKTKGPNVNWPSGLVSILLVGLVLLILFLIKSLFWYS